jgi:Domain of unknown function (DUF4397)
MLRRSRRLCTYQHPSGRLTLLLALTLPIAMMSSAPLALAQEATPTVTGVPDATVRVVHASPDAPAINVLVDGQQIAQDLAYGTATEYAPLSPGDHHVQVVLTNGHAPIIDQTVTFEGWASYILEVVGQFANIQLVANAVDVSPTSPGEARLRFVNAVPNGPALSLGTVGSEIGLAIDIGFPNASGYLTTGAGTYDLEVRNADSEETLASVPGFQFAAGHVYDLYALGQGADGQIQILPLITPVAIPCSQTLGTGEPTDSCLRVIHAAPDTGPVDVYIDEAPVARGLKFGDASHFAAAPSGEQQLRIVPAGAPVDQAVIDTSQNLTVGEAGQITLTGLANDLQASIVGVDLRPLPENQARVRVVHASPDLEAIDVSIAGGPTPFVGIDYRGQSGYVVFDAGTYSFQLRESGANTLLLTADDVQIKPGMVYDIVVIGKSENGTLQMVFYEATAGVLTGQPATPIAGTSAPAASPALPATPVVAVGSTPVTVSHGAAATPTS